MADLLPCPFCSKTMMLRSALWPSEGDADAIIHADPTDCPMLGFSDGSADGSIIEKWNCSLSNEDDFPSDGSCVRCGSVPRNANGLCNTCLDEDAERLENTRPTPVAPVSPEPDGEPFQNRVKPWMLACFGEEISNDKLERCDRFIEEALELVQSIGYSPDRARALVDYVFNREIGEPHQEVGGVMVTLAALCLASDLDMAKAGEDELARIWTKVEKIRAKQAAKPTGSALPVAVSPDATGKCGELETVMRRYRGTDWPEHYPWAYLNESECQGEAGPRWIVEELCLRSQVVELLAAEREKALFLKTAMEIAQTHCGLKDKTIDSLEADNEAKDARIKELDRCHEGTIDLCNQKTAQIEALEAKLAAAELALRAARPYVEDYDTRRHNTGVDETLTQIDAALGGKPS